MSKTVSKLKEEFLKMLPPAIFFFVAFHVIALVRNLLIKASGIELTTTASVLVAALVLGKVVLIADMLPFINRYPDKPLIYNILWKTGIYTVLSILIHYLEHLIEHWREAGSLGEANRALLAQIVWPHFWAVQILLVSMIFLYVVGREIVRAIGPQRARTMTFGGPSRAAG